MERYFLQVLYDIFQIPMVCWDRNCGFLQPEGRLFDSPVVSDEAMRKELEQACGKNEFPILYLEDEWVYYGVFEGAGGMWMCFGPVSVRNIRKMELESYRKAHHIKGKLAIPHMNMGLMTKLLALAFSQSTGKRPDYAEISIKCRMAGLEQWNEEQMLENYLFQQSEHERCHGSAIQFEARLLDIVKSGDVGAMKEILSGKTPKIDEVSEVTPNHRKEMEYMLIITLTLITRAAVEGGMAPEAAYELGDVYLRQLETCHGETGALTMLGVKAQIAFTEKVREAKKQRSQYIYVDKCKDYIAKNLRKDIRVSDIAPAIGISRGYLSHRFAEAEGISIQQYILQEKCHHAANLLKFSDYSIALISEYFGFSSPSHFTSSFKKIFHMTPKEYRQHYSRG